MQARQLALGQQASSQDLYGRELSDFQRALSKASLSHGFGGSSQEPDLQTGRQLAHSPTAALQSRQWKHQSCTTISAVQNAAELPMQTGSKLSDLSADYRVACLCCGQSQPLCTQLLLLCLLLAAGG